MISSKHPSNSICGLGRAAGNKETQEQKPSDSCLFTFLITVFLATSADKLISTWKWSWLGHHFIPCVLHNMNWAILLDYSNLERRNRASKSFINCSMETAWLLTLLNDKAHPDIDKALSSMGEASVPMIKLKGTKQLELHLKHTLN